MDDKIINQQIALARFALIAPVIHDTFNEQSAAQYYRRVAEKPFIAPDGKAYNYSPRTYESWTRKYKHGGIEALEPKKRSDKGYRRKLSEDAIAALYALKGHYPKMNATIMYERLIADRVIDSTEVSLSTVERFCKLSFNKLASNPGGKDRRAFSSERINGIWQADTLYGPYLKSPRKRTYLQAVIDDKSRCIVAARFYLADNAANFQITLKNALGTWGIPEKIYVDNGSAYRNDQLAMICARMGIVLIHAPVRDGAAKGKIERWNRNCRSRFINLLEESDTDSLTSLNDALAAFVKTYNTTLHSSLNARPIDVFSEEAHLTKKPASTKWLDECFLNKVCRKVGRDATVRIDKQEFDCPMAYIGTRVEIRYDPADMKAIFLCDDDRSIECFPTDRVANSKAKRSPAYEIDYTIKDKEPGENHV